MNNVFTAVQQVHEGRGWTGTVVQALWGFAILIAPTLPIAAAAQVRVPNRVSVQATVTPTNGSAPLAVRFSAKGSPPSAEASSPASYLWDFGDGATSKVPDAIHTYSRPGKYQATVTYTRFINLIDPPERREQARRTFIVNVTAPALLKVSPPRLVFNGQVGSKPSPQSLSIVNAGSSPLGWSVSGDAPAWLRLSAESGSLGAGQSIQLQTFVLTAGLTAADYQHRLIITSREATNSPVVVIATLSLRPKPYGRLLTPAVMALGALAILVGAALLVLKLSRSGQSLHTAVSVKPMPDLGTQHVKAQGTLVPPSLEIRIMPDSGVRQIRVRGNLVGNVRKMKGEAL